MFVPDTLAEEKSIILALLNAAAGKDCSKDCEYVLLIDAYLLLTKHSDLAGDSWATWEAQPVKIVPQVETVETLRSMQVCPSLDNFVALLVLKHSIKIYRHVKLHWNT